MAFADNFVSLDDMTEETYVHLSSNVDECTEMFAVFEDGTLINYSRLARNSVCEQRDTFLKHLASLFMRKQLQQQVLAPGKRGKVVTNLKSEKLKFITSLRKLSEGRSIIQGVCVRLQKRNVHHIEIKVHDASFKAYDAIWKKYDFCSDDPCKAAYFYR